MDDVTRKKVLELAAQGIRQIDISKQCDVPLSTVSKLVCGAKTRKKESPIPQALWNEWDEVRQSVSKALERKQRHVRTCGTNRKSYGR